MCGYFGAISSKNINLDRAKKSLEILNHRGPDNTSFSYKNNIFLGHKRLSIIDLSPLGNQPMMSNDNSIQIVFNGEIYNFEELKKELILSGVNFYSNSDTEVILKGYVEWGFEETLKKLNGMFSIAIVDENIKSVFLARDHAGIKPLFYSQQNNDFTFSSELNPINKYLGYTSNENLDYTALYDFLTYLYIPTPKTAFLHIKKLEPGHFIEYDFKNKKVSKKKYWELDLYENDYKENDLIDLLEEKLVKTISMEQISDVPIGYFLSGGIDSGIVSTIGSKLNSNKNTFSIYFNDPLFDESKLIKNTQQTINSNHKFQYLEKDDIKNLIEQGQSWFGEPFGDVSYIPTNLVSQLAAQDLKVVLTGDGGDEVFGGYDRFLYVSKNINRKIPKIDFLKNSYLANKLNNKDIFSRIYRRLRLEFALNPLEMYTLFMNGMLKEEKLEYKEKFNIPNDYDDYWYFRSFYRADLPVLKRLQYLDFKTYLVDDNLTKVDRASMQCSIECRVPLLNKDLVNFVFSIKTSLIWKNSKKKYLLRKIAEKYLPNEILQAKKKGFSIPSYEWIVKPSNKKYLGEVILDKFLN